MSHVLSDAEYHAAVTVPLLADDPFPERRRRRPRPARARRAPSTNGEIGAPPTPSPSPNADNGRDNRGRFQKGNAGGPGNPFARQTAALRKALVATVNEEDIKDMVYMLLVKAKGGDIAAIKLLFAYVVGRPTEAIDPDALDQQDSELPQQSFQPTPIAPPAETPATDPTEVEPPLDRAALPANVREDVETASRPVSAVDPDNVSSATPTHSTSPETDSLAEKEQCTGAPLDPPNGPQPLTAGHSVEQSESPSPGPGRRRDPPPS